MTAARHLLTGAVVFPLAWVALALLIAADRLLTLARRMRAALEATA